MKVRFVGNYYICECGNTMLYLDPLGDVTRRRIVCSCNPQCLHHQKIFLEPVFKADPA